MGCRGCPSPTDVVFGKVTRCCLSSSSWQLNRSNVSLAGLLRRAASPPSREDFPASAPHSMPDDAAIFIRLVLNDMMTLRRILDTFGRASGLQVNFSKSAAIPIRCSDVDLPQIPPLTIPVMELPCPYLGMPLSIRSLKKNDLQPLLDKMANRLSSWKSGFFSAASRLVLLRAVLSAIPVYTLSSHHLPAWFVKDCDKIRRGWLWAANTAALGGQCKVAWRAVCRPQRLGGLGIHDLVAFGRALRLRWLWHERVSPDKPWIGLPTPCSEVDRDLFALATFHFLG